MTERLVQDATFQENPLAYAARLERRDPADIDLIVVHCTELPDLATAREFGERVHYRDSQTGNSGHFYIDRDGTTSSWVPISRVAHHVRGFNERSIGIELVNRGRWPDWLDTRSQRMTEPYPEPQIDALCRLLDRLGQMLPGLRWISGHEQLDREKVRSSNDPERTVYRKRDPGPLFPWKKVLHTSRLELFSE